MQASSFRVSGPSEKMDNHKQLWIQITTLSILFCSQSARGFSGKLLLISMDGFRWDYLDQQWDDLPNFRRMATEGVRAPYMENTYSTVTFSGHYSIATGLNDNDIL